MVGIFVAQLLRLQHSPSPNPVLGFYVVSIPLATIFHTLAILVLLIGTGRFFKLQKALALGKSLSGGWELLVIGGLSGAVSLPEVELLNAFCSLFSDYTYICGSHHCYRR